MDPPDDAYPRRDGEVAGFAGSLGLAGIVDLHVHFLPPRLQRAVWDYFDGLDDPPWPIRYREDEPGRLRTLADLGVVAHTALAYPHQAGMLGWLNDHTLGLAERHRRVIPTFTLYPEEGVADAVDDALRRGGVVAKVHLQVGRFHATDPRLAPAWRRLERASVPVVLHAGAVYGARGGAGYCGPDEVVALLEQHPDLRIVIAHLGAPDHAGFVALAERAPTVWLDTAMVLTDPPFFPPVPAPLIDRLRELADRIVFGSDFPTIPHAYAAQVRGLARLRLGRPGLRGILHDNAVRLLEGTDDAGDEP